MNHRSPKVPKRAICSLLSLRNTALGFGPGFTSTSYVPEALHACLPLSGKLGLKCLLNTPHRELGKSNDTIKMKVL